MRCEFEADEGAPPAPLQNARRLDRERSVCATRVISIRAAGIEPPAPPTLPARPPHVAYDLSRSGARREGITDRLIDHISVSRVARSNVISITASSVDPSKAALPELPEALHHV